MGMRRDTIRGYLSTNDFYYIISVILIFRACSENPYGGCGGADSVSNGGLNTSGVLSAHRQISVLVQKRHFICMHPFSFKAK